MSKWCTLPSGLCVPGNFRSDKDAFEDLLDKTQAYRVTLACIQAVEDSFLADRKLAGAYREGRIAGPLLKERFDICEDLVRTWRGDLKWPVRKILDTLPHALRAKLNGDHFEPSERKGWRAKKEGVVR